MEIGLLVSYGLLFVSLFFEVFLLVSFLERRFVKKTTPEQIPLSALPKVAIVVPCFNEERGVAATLASLLSLSYPKDKLEIAIVDDGSTDRTFEVISEYASDPRVKIYRKENGGKYTAMNLALANTDADLIGCLDADSVVHPQALLRIAQVFQNPKIAAVTPGIHVRNPETLLQHMQNAEYRLSVFNRFILATLGAVFITPGAFSIFRTSVVRELGGWRHGHSTEDMEMALRLQVAGHLIANAPGATVHTEAPSTVRSLFRQRVRWWYGWLRNVADYRFMIGNSRYGNLGLIIFPAFLLSISAGIYLFVKILLYSVISLVQLVERILMTGVFPDPRFELFYINTSAMLFLISISLVLIFTLICIGSLIGTGTRRPPAGTPLFLLFYSFLAPIWLCTAVVRALFKTGVSWR